MTIQQQILKEYSKRSLYNFVKLFWREVETAQYTDNYHIKLICDKLEERFIRQVKGKKGKDINVNVPPGSSKSLIASIFYPCWIWLHKPSTKIITASYSHKIAEELCYKSGLILTSELYRSISAVKLKTANTTMIRNKFNGYRFVTSSSGSVTGIHADVIILDDINSPQSIHSPADRELARKFVQEIIPSRVTSPELSYMVNIQQRLHFEDATSYLLNNDAIVIPAIDSNGESFFPNRFSIEFLNKMKERLGTKSFNAQYMQIVQPEEGGIIKNDWCPVEDVPFNTNLIYAIDSAYGQVNGDYTAIVSGYKKDNIIYIYKSERNKLEFPDLIKYIKNNIPNNAKVYIEGKASGKSIVQSLRKETNINVVEVQPKGSKLQRKHALSPIFESRRVVFNKDCGRLIEELTNDNSKNDDLADACMYVIEELNKNNGNYIIY